MYVCVYVNGIILVNYDYIHTVKALHTYIQSKLYIHTYIYTYIQIDTRALTYSSAVFELLLAEAVLDHPTLGRLHQRRGHPDLALLLLGNWNHLHHLN